MSNEKDYPQEFIELFEVQGYTGILEELGEQIESVNGVKDVSLKTSKHQNPLSQAHNEDVTVEITYSPIETDRTQLCLDIEDFETVSGEALSA